MTGRPYGQYCGLARAMELIGERWAMLVVRDLVLRPRTFTELRTNLRGVPPTVLSARLNELERGRLLRRRMDDDPVTYELTDYGRDLEPVLLALGRWGARALGEPRAGDVVPPDTTVLALRSTFVPDGGRDAVYVVDLGHAVVTARVSATALDVTEGRVPDPDVTMTFLGPPTPVLTGEVEPAHAVRAGLLVVSGDATLAERFPRLFSIPATPPPVAPLVEA